jgi:uncharacterized membrane protein
MELNKLSFMEPHYKKNDKKRNRAITLSRLEALGDAIFAFALTLLALDIRLPEIESNALAQGILSLLPKLLVFVFTFLLIAQEWDVHQRTMMHIVRTDGIFVWIYLLSLMCVVLMPVSANVLGRYPVQPLAIIFFGVNTALLNLASWIMWQYASHKGHLLDDNVEPYVVKLLSRLWVYPPIIIVVTMPLSFVSVYPVYIIWFFMPVISYSYSTWTFRRYRKNLK